MLISHTLRRCRNKCAEIRLHRQDLPGGSLGLQRLLLQSSTGTDFPRTAANQKLDLNEKFLPKLILKAHFSTRQETFQTRWILGDSSLMYLKAIGHYVIKRALRKNLQAVSDLFQALDQLKSTESYLPGISEFQCVNKTDSPLDHLNVPFSSTSESPIQKYLSVFSPTRLVR